MSFDLEVEMVSLASKMCLFSIVYVATYDEARAMAKAGADAVIAHVGTTVGGAIGVTGAVCSMEDAAARCEEIFEGVKSVRDDVFLLSHGGPINTPEDAEHINTRTDAVGFVGASSLERMAVEESLTALTRKFKSISVERKPEHV